MFGDGFSAACNIVLCRQLYVSLIVFWSCTFVIMLSLRNCIQFALTKLHFCCYLMEASLSSSLIMGQWSLPLSSYSSLHFYSGAIIRLVSLLSICSHCMLCSRCLLFHLVTRGCIFQGFSLALSLLCLFFHFLTMGCVHWSLPAIS